MPVPRRRARRRSFALAAGLAVLSVVAVAGPAGARYEPEPGTVVVRDDMDRSNIVRFIVPAGSPIGPREVAAAAAAAGVANGGMEERPSGRRGVRELRLHTSLSVRTSFLTRRIEAGRLRGLDVFHQGRLVLELHPWATVAAGEVRRLDSDLLFRRYAVAGDGDVAYRIPGSAMLRPLVLVLLLTLVPYAGLRAYAGRVAASDADPTDKAHRLRGAMLAVSLALPLVLVAGLFLGGLFQLPGVLLGGLAPGLSRSPAAEAIGTVLLLVLLLLASLVPAARAIGAEHRKLHGVTVTRASRTGNARVGLAFVLPLLLLWLPLAALSLATGLPEAVRLGLQACWLVVVLAAMPLVAVRLMPTRPLEGPRRGRLDALVERAGGRIRELRVLDTRSQKLANALVMGPVPRLRYVIVTDYLLETLQEDEVEAVVAHELGHARQHHVLVKLGALLAFAVVVGVGLAAGRPLFRALGPMPVVVAVPLLLMVALLLVQGGLGLVLERKADDYAARLVGVDPMIRGLERLAEVNLLKRRTGPLWNLLTHHPGIAQRIERLRAQQLEQPETPPAPTANP
jgi:Zn-dependent protease with chaperone function